MPENNFERKYPLQCEDVIRSVNTITEIATRAGIPVEQILHIGGIPVMLHACTSSRSSRYVINWRGTADIDIATTIIGGVQRLADALSDAGIEVLSRRPSRSIRNKYALEIGLDTAKGYFPSDRKLEIDVYSGDAKGIATLNQRHIQPYPGTVVLHTAETHHCWGHEFTVPHAIDALILKTDVLKDTIRKKDIVDVSSLFFSCENYGLLPGQVANELKLAHSAATTKIPLPFWYSRLAPELIKVCQNQDLRKYDFIPVASHEYLKELVNFLKS